MWWIARLIVLLQLSALAVRHHEQEAKIINHHPKGATNQIPFPVKSNQKSRVSHIHSPKVVETDESPTHKISPRNFAQQSNSNDLNVFIIPHSHCDPGWLETFEGYYSSQVSRILDSVTSALSHNAARKFVWAETSYFKRWYERQSREKKQVVKSMIKNQQLEIVGGGWVQHDEANPDVFAIINQVFLKF